MTPNEEWAAIVSELRQASSPFKSTSFRALVAVAQRDGMIRLRWRFKSLDDVQREDIVNDVVVTKLNEIVAVTTTSPRAFYLVAVERRALDLIRHLGVREDKVAELREVLTIQQSRSADEDALIDNIDRQRKVSALSESDYQLLMQIGAGEDRAEIARRRGTTRANIDQRISRLRRLLGEGKP